MISPGRLILGTLVLIAGVIFLLVNLKLIPGLKLEHILDLWPLLVIFMGIRLLLGHRHFSTWLALLIVLIMVAITVAALFLVTRTGVYTIELNLTAYLN